MNDPAAPTTTTTTSTDSRPQVLCVDDEVRLLDANALYLRRKYNVLQATSGASAIEVLKKHSPAVIISDMRMPGMDGAALLEYAFTWQPRCTRILLTGQADLNAAAAAVNKGQIFRFLTKPCDSRALMDAVADAVEQNRLLEAEQLLLDRTLRGAVKALSGLLAIIDPSGFGRSALVKDIALRLDAQVGAQLGWQLEVATTFVHAGVATLPAATRERVARASRLNVEEQSMLDRLPAVVASIIRDIPRLEEAAEIVAALDHAWADDGKSVPRGARILRLAIDAAAVEAAGTDSARVAEVLRQRHGRYEPALLDALHALLAGSTIAPARVLTTDELHAGMVLIDDLKSAKGLLIVPRGTEVTTGLLERIKNFPPGFLAASPRVRERATA